MSGPSRFLGVVFISILATVEPSQAGEFRGIRRNNEGVTRFKGGKAHEAYDRFTSALADLPFDPVVHVNLGDNFMLAKDMDKALSEYSQSLKLAPGNSGKERSVRFHAYFNSGLAFTEKKMIDEALASYQQALEIDPESKETKTNIELLTQAGGGGGKGDDKSDKKDQSKDGEGDQPQKQPQKFDDQKQKQKPKPKPYDGKEVSQQDVNRILDELKNQEEQIRAKMDREGVTRDAPNDKDW